MDEVMFLQGNVEEKIGTLRLGGELANIAKTKAEVELLADQEALTEQQLSTEVEETVKRTAEKDLLLAQELKVDEETKLVTSQTTQLDAQTAIEATAEKAFFDGVVAGAQNTYRDFAAEMRIMGVQESDFQQAPAYKKVELLADALKLRTATATETGTDTLELSEVNKVMRFIGESPVSSLNSNSLASEAVRILRDTDTELQGRGWWFNTEEDVELNSTTISVTTSTTSPVTTTTTTTLPLSASSTSFSITGVNVSGGDSADGTYTLDNNTNEWNGPNGHSFFIDSSTSNTYWVLRDIDDDNPYTGSSALVGSEKPWEAFYSTAVLSSAVFSSLETTTTTTTENSTTTTTEDINAVAVNTDMLSVEANDYDTIVKTAGDNQRVLYDLKTKSFDSFPLEIKAKIIYQRPLNDTPIKYREYLSVRVAMLLTELYPQSISDMTRLPKIEEELRTYFKDREFDDANYSVFDNYDAASRIGINRNYNLF